MDRIDETIMKKSSLNLNRLFYIIINQSKFFLLCYWFVIILIFFVANINSESITWASNNEKNSTANLDYNNFIQYTNSSMGIEIIYPINWEIENNGVIDFDNITLINPSTQVLMENKDSKIKHTTSTTNILDTLPFFVELNKYNYSINTLNNITFPYLSIFSSIENSTDNFAENIRIIPNIISSNITLNELFENIFYVVDTNCYKNYPSIKLQDIILSSSIIYLNQQSLKYYVMVFTDLYDACIDSFELINEESVMIGDNTGYQVLFTYNLKTKLEHTTYKILQNYFLKDNKLHLFTYNALENTFNKYLPIIQTMLNSLKIY